MCACKTRLAESTDVTYEYTCSDFDWMWCQPVFNVGDKRLLLLFCLKCALIQHAWVTGGKREREGREKGGRREGEGREKEGERERGPRQT